MKQRTFFAALLLLIFTALGMPAQSVFAATVTAGTGDELVAAISAANLNPDADTIILTSDITLTNHAETSDTYSSTGLPPVTTPITIEGQGHTIKRDVGAPVFRIFRIATGGNLTLYNLTVSGGNIAYANGCNTLLQTCGGGAFNEGTLTIVNSTFTLNKAIRGGGIYNNVGGSLTIIDSTFSYNAAINATSQQGGAVYTTTGTVTITDSVFMGNVTDGTGGAIFSYLSTVNISGSTFYGNMSAFNGGAIAGSVNINRSTFSNNTANINWYGGAVYLFRENGTVSNSTFSGNSAGGGGAIYFGALGGDSYSLTVNGSTFSGNSAPTYGGGGILDNTVPVNVRNSIIVNSTGGNCGTIAGAVGSAVNGDGFSLTDDNTGCSGFTNSSSINLGPLAYYGGATQTFALSVGSAAIDSGSPVCSNSLTDQRGGARVNACDVGAFEYGAPLRSLGFATPSSSILVGLTNTVPVTVTLDAPLTGASAVTAYIWVNGGSAVAGTDYAPFRMQTVTINPGQTTATVTLTLLNPPSSDQSILLSFALKSGPAFNGAAYLYGNIVHEVTLKPSAPTAAANRNFYDTDTPTLTWTAISNASGYEIQVDSDTAFSAPYSFTDTAIPAGQLSKTTTHLDNGTYFWRVRAKGKAVWSTPERIEVFKLP
ncbi:MAG: choice-of-anchor Q domain-containing protein [Chloroflexota bacterium]